MTTSLTAFRKIQVGKEAIRGTGVAATKKLVGSITMTPNIAFHRPPDEYGSLAEFRRTKKISQGATMAFTGDLTYDQFLYFLAMSMKGSVEPALANPNGAKHDDNGIFANLTNAIDGSLATSNTISFVATQDKLYVRSATDFCGLKFRGPTTAPVYNAVASIISTIECSDGAGGWLPATLVLDKTLSAGASMGQNGMISFIPATAWASGTVDGDAGFWIRITWSAGWTAGVKLASLQTVSKPAIWTFTPTLTAVNTPDSYTLEYGDDVQEWESVFVICTSWEITLALNQIASFRADLRGRFPSKSTFTASLLEPVINEAAVNELQIWIDGTWATLGSTEKASLLLGGTIRFDSQLSLVKYADGSFDFSNVVERRRHLAMDLEFKTSTPGITEYDAWVAATLRAIRLKLTNADGLYIQVDSVGRYHTEPTIFEERDGENYLRVQHVSMDDGSGNEFSVVVVNNESELG